MKTLFNKGNRKNWIMTVITLIIAIAALFYLPDTIPTHFNSAGTPDSFGSRYTVFLFPGLLFLFVIGAELFRNIDPKKENYDKFEKFYYSFFFLLDLMFLVLELVIISYALGYRYLNTTTIITFIVGIMLAFIGNMLPKIKPNYYMGIRTSWALADSNNWYKTHRFAGKVWMIGGILIALMPFVLSSKYLVYGILAMVLVLSLIPAIASYIYFVKDK